MIFKTDQPEKLAKRIFFIAWKNCAPPMGMGLFQHNPLASEHDVWNNVMSSGDYFGPNSRDPQSPYGDYVFGKMMKMGFKIHSDSIEFRDNENWRPDYQSFCKKFPTPEALVKAAEDSLAPPNSKIEI